jgi:hypothetical protein
MVGRQLDADDEGGLRVQLQQHAGPAAAEIGGRIAQPAERTRDDQPILQQGRSDRRDGGRAELGDVANLYPGNRPLAPDRVHDMETVDRAHQFGIGGFHRDPY